MIIDKEQLMEVLAEEECLTADGFDDALVGFTCGANTVAVYDMSRMIDILIAEGMEHDDAVEHIDYNVIGNYAGEKTPKYVGFVTEEDQNY